VTTAKQGDTVQVHYTGTLTDGTVFDSSTGRDPLEFTIGEEQVIPGFESAVVGLGIGDRKEVAIGPEDAYGPRHPDRVFVVSRSQLPDEIEPRPGMMLQGRMPDGSVDLVVTNVSDEGVTLDANHPLAGKELHFAVELVAIVT
jgi:peptidylprolyl isomerase